MMHELSHDLGHYVVTEGIETCEQAQRLVSLGGRVVQGYWIAKAMPQDDVVPWLQAMPKFQDLFDSSPIADTPAPRYGEVD